MAKNRTFCLLPLSFSAFVRGNSLRIQSATNKKVQPAINEELRCMLLWFRKAAA